MGGGSSKAKKQTKQAVLAAAAASETTSRGTRREDASPSPSERRIADSTSATTKTSGRRSTTIGRRFGGEDDGGAEQTAAARSISPTGWSSKPKRINPNPTGAAPTANAKANAATRGHAGAGSSSRSPPKGSGSRSADDERRNVGGERQRQRRQEPMDSDDFEGKFATDDEYDEDSEGEGEEEDEEPSPLRRRRPRNSLLNLPALPDGHGVIKVAPMATEYARYELIGRGGFSTVHMVKRIKTGEWYAAKIVPLDNIRKKDADEDTDAAAMAEAVLQMRLRHDSIVKIIDVFHEPGIRGCFIEELMRGGTVHEWRSKGALSERDSCAIFSRLVDALKYLHKHDVVHCDIKLENLLLREKRDPTSVKLADFGLAKVIDETGTGTGSGSGGGRRRRKSGNMVGTLGFMAPEVVFGLNFTLGGTRALGGVRTTLRTMRASFGPEVDLWSAGVALYIMLGGSMQTLWPENSPAAVLSMPVGETWGCFQRTAVSGLKTALPFPKDRFANVSAEARSIVTRCMECAPQKRPTAARVVTEAWCVDGLTMQPPSRVISPTPPAASSAAGFESRRRPGTTGGGSRMMMMQPPGFVAGIPGGGYDDLVSNPYRPDTVDSGHGDISGNQRGGISSRAGNRVGTTAAGRATKAAATTIPTVPFDDGGKGGEQATAPRVVTKEGSPNAFPARHDGGGPSSVEDSDSDSDSESYCVVSSVAPAPVAAATTSTSSPPGGIPKTTALPSRQGTFTTDTHRATLAQMQAQLMAMQQQQDSQARLLAMQRHHENLAAHGFHHRPQTATMTTTMEDIHRPPPQRRMPRVSSHGSVPDVLSPPIAVAAAAAAAKNHNGTSSSPVDAANVVSTYSRAENSLKPRPAVDAAMTSRAPPPPQHNIANTNNVYGGARDAAAVAPVGVGVGFGLGGAPLPYSAKRTPPYSAATATTTTSSYASSYASSTPPSAAQNMEIFRQTFIDPSIKDPEAVSRLQQQQSSLALNARLQQQLQAQQLQLQQMQLHNQRQQQIRGGQIRQQQQHMSTAEQRQQYRKDIFKQLAEIGDGDVV